MTMIRIERLAGLLALAMLALAVTVVVVRGSLGLGTAGLEAANPRNPTRYLDLARAYANRGDLQAADAQYRAALSVDPTLRGVHGELADLEMREHLTAAALSDYETELQLAPDDVRARAGSARARASLGPIATAASQARNIRRPRTTPRVIAAHTAKPTISPSPSPNAKPSPSPRASAKPVRVVARISRPRAPEVSATPPQGSPVWGRIGPDSGVGTQNLAQLSREAGQYLSGVTQDVNFTGALPAGDPEQSRATLQRRLSTASRDPRGWSEEIAKVGTSALYAGYSDLAASAFRMLANADARDWRGLYYLGLTAQYQGDNERALSYFTLASARASRPEILTSVAIIKYRSGDVNGARAAASQATGLDRSYEQAYFVSGMLSLVDADVPSAQRDLSTAVSLGPAPAKTQYFLDSLRHG